MVLPRIAQFIQKNFWIFFFGGIVLGIAVPGPGEGLISLLQPMLMFNLLLVFLKMDLREVTKGITNIRLMSYLALLFLIVIPILTYFVVKPFDETLALGFLLLAAMPPGVSSPALTDLMKGNVALSMSILIVCSIVAPFSVPLLFQYFTPVSFPLDTWSMFWTLALLIFIPFILAYAIKQVLAKTVLKVVPYVSALNVLMIFLFVYTAIATQQSFITANIPQTLWLLVLLYVFFIVLHLVGYLAGSGREKKDKIAISISKSYMNNGLAIVIAVSYFSPPIVLLAVLSEIPWGTLLAPFRSVLRL